MTHLNAWPITRPPTWLYPKGRFLAKISLKEDYLSIIDDGQSISDSDEDVFIRLFRSNSQIVSQPKFAQVTHSSNSTDTALSQPLAPRLLCPRQAIHPDIGVSIFNDSYLYPNGFILTRYGCLGEECVEAPVPVGQDSHWSPVQPFSTINGDYFIPRIAEVRRWKNYPNLPHHVGQNFFALPPIPDNVVTIESPCVNLSWMYHTHFGHWVTDVLPKIGILKLLHYDLNSFKYILQDPIPSFAIESLACLGIEPSNILSHNGSVMRFKKLWSPSKLMRVWDWVHPLGTDFLRDMAKSLPCDMIPLTHEIPQSVYLSRADSTKRFLKNEEQLSLKLAEYGITPLITSRFSFAERLLVMSKVSRVVGSLGSNVLNALFSGEKEVRGVLFADSDGIDMALATQNMARCTGHKYVYLLGERAIASGESAEWTINPDEVINAFESL